MPPSRHRTGLLLCVGLVLAACAPNPPAEEDPATQAETPVTGGTVALSVLTMENPFFKSISDSMGDTLLPAGYGLTAVSGDFDVAKQQHQIEGFIVQKVDAIVLCPCDSKAIGPAIKAANDAGIPVFTADIACLDPEAKVVAHVATDNEQGGRLAADAVAEAIGGQGKVAILDHPVVESVMLRTKGFKARIEELNQSGKAIEIVATLPGGGEKAKSLAAAQDLIQAHPDLNAIFAINDPSALGAVAALENAGKAGQIKVIGFDGQPEGKQAIKAGAIFADPIQFPDEIGKQTAELVLKYLSGEEVPSEVLIPTKLYQQADTQADPALQDG